MIEFAVHSRQLPLCRLRSQPGSPLLPASTLPPLVILGRGSMDTGRLCEHAPRATHPYGHIYWRAPRCPDCEGIDVDLFRCSLSFCLIPRFRLLRGKRSASRPTVSKQESGTVWTAYFSRMACGS